MVPCEYVRDFALFEGKITSKVYIISHTGVMYSYMIADTCSGNVKYLLYYLHQGKKLFLDADTLSLETK